MDDKVVVITGGTSGIGRALCDRFINENYKVVIAARSQDQLLEVKNFYASLNQTLLTVKTDVRVENDCKALVDKTIEKYGSIDIFINNAGITWYEDEADGINVEKQKDLIDTNFFGVVYCTKYALPHLLKSKGSLVGICSIAGEVGLPNRSAYSSSKFAMNGFLRSIRVQYLHSGLHVLNVYAGYTATNIRKTLKNNYSYLKLPLGYGNDKNMKSPELLADKIYRGIKKGRKCLRPTLRGNVTVFLNRVLPRFNDRLISRFYK